MPRLSTEVRNEFRALATRPDWESDPSEIPDVQQIPSDAVTGKFYRPRKTAVTIRLDADVLAWLKASGEGYQTRVNAHLRELMRQHR